MKTITVKLPETLASWLSSRAAQLGRSQGDLVRDALLASKGGTGTRSCHDAFSDVCGTVDGPKDLSTNPKHMRGFGE